MKDVGCPKEDVEAAARRLKGLKEAVTQRNVRVETLAKSLPGTLYRAVDEADVRVQREVSKRTVQLCSGERFERAHLRNGKRWVLRGIPKRTLPRLAKPSDSAPSRGQDR